MKDNLLKYKAYRPERDKAVVFEFFNASNTCGLENPAPVA